MNALLEIGITLLAAVGAVALGWKLFGALVTPLPSGCAHLVVTGWGSGEELERTVRGLDWLQGGRRCGRVVVADLGLNQHGLAVVEALARDGLDIALCPGEQLHELLRQDYTGRD